MKRAKECCMCGDIGFSHELFQCTACLYRSQHTYCSCMYPKAESYRICDWCLKSGEERKESKQIFEKCTETDAKKVSHGSKVCFPGLHAIKKHKSIFPERAYVDTVNPKAQKFGREGNHKLQRVEPAENGCVKNRMSRCKEIFGNNAAHVAIAGSKGSTRPLVKVKVRRYKLLEEVSA